MNKNQCTENYWQKQNLKVVPSHPSLVACLRDMGHEVEQRYVKIGEDLSSYDRVIMYVHGIGGFSQFAYNGLWALSQRPDAILAFDDWQIKQIIKDCKYNQNRPNSLINARRLELNKHVPANLSDYIPQLIEGLKLVADQNSPVLVSAFAGGDLSLLLPDWNKDKIYTYNPNPYHFNRQPIEGLFGPNPKQKVFNFAGLVQKETKKWLKHQNIEETGWPLKLYGSKKDGQDRVTEDHMVTLYSEHWGILMPGYKHAGSGWWRARPLQVADAGSVLIGEPKEMMLYYKNEELSSITAKQVAEMTDEQLRDFAKRQRDALYANHPLDKNVQQREITEVLFCEEFSRPNYDQA